VQPFRKYCLLNGFDDIGLTLRQADKIRAFEAKRLATKPWLAPYGNRSEQTFLGLQRHFPSAGSYQKKQSNMKIAVLPGDGIGTEIVAEAVKV
jgi:hypothetical protein